MPGAPIIRVEGSSGNAVRAFRSAKSKYNEVSNQFWTPVHKTLAGDGSAADSLAALEISLTKLKGSAW